MISSCTEAIVLFREWLSIHSPEPPDDGMPRDMMNICRIVCTLFARWCWRRIPRDGERVSLRQLCFFISTCRYVSVELLRRESDSRSPAVVMRSSSSGRPSSLPLSRTTRRRTAGTESITSRHPHRKTSPLSKPQVSAEQSSAGNQPYLPSGKRQSSAISGFFTKRTYVVVMERLLLSSWKQGGRTGGKYYMV